MIDSSTTIAIICYNSAHYIESCLSSVLHASPNCPVLVIDNASHDASVDIIQSVFPAVHLVALQQNIGHSAACNLALQLARTTWVLLLDHDTTVPEGWLEPLLEVAEQMWPQTAMVSSRAILITPGQQPRIHHDGGYAHYVAHMTLRNGFSDPEQAQNVGVAEVGAQAATSLLVHRERALEVGGFDARFFIYLNDFELSLRLRLRGWRCYIEPRSLVYHHQGNPETSWRGQGSYPARRAFLIYRNRWMLLAKIYSLRTLILCAPMLLVYELVLLAAALRNGWWQVYCAALADIRRHWPALMIQRRHIQATRVTPDSELLSAHHLSYVRGLVEKPVARMAKQSIERILAIYWRLISPFLG